MSGTITLRVAAKTGTLKVTSADLTSRDENSADIALTAVDSAQATASAGGTGNLIVRGAVQPLCCRSVTPYPPR